VVRDEGSRSDVEADRPTEVVRSWSWSAGAGVPAGMESSPLMSRNRRLNQPAARQVRINLIQSVRNYGAAVIIALSIRLIEILIIFSVLIRVRDAVCDKPLHLFLALTALQQFGAVVLHLCKVPNVRPEQQPRWIQWTESVFGMTMFAWFVCGNVWTFSAQECDPTLHTAALVLVLFIYFCISLPLIIILLIIFCLPFAALLLPILIRYLPEQTNAEKAATMAQIETLEKRTFTAGDYEEADANCCICLSDYAPGAELRVLPCRHHFHTTCVDQWLQTSAVCPLCKTPPFEAREEGAQGAQAAPTTRADARAEDAV